MEATAYSDMFGKIFKKHDANNESSADAVNQTEPISEDSSVDKNSEEQILTQTNLTIDTISTKQHLNPI